MTVSEASPRLPAVEEQKRGLIDRPVIFIGLALLSFLVFLQFQIRLSFEFSSLASMEADDALRLQQVRDLLAGQGWFDLHQYRDLPPNGVLMHWSRLVDAPIAGLILLLRAFFGGQQAEFLVRLIWPALLFLIYLAASSWALTRLFGARAAALAVVVATNLLMFSFLFSIGELDHHNVQAILILASAIAFAFADDTGPTPALLGGAFAAISLAIGLETLPFVAAIALTYVFAWIVDARHLRTLCLFAAALAFTSLLAFFAQTSPSRWLVPACDVLAPPLLVLVCGGSALVAALALSNPMLRSAQARFWAAAVGGAALIGAVALLFPSCLAGPYHAVPEPIRSAWLGAIGETHSLQNFLTIDPVKALKAIGPVLAAAAAAWVGAIQTTGRPRRLLVLTAVLLTLTLVMSTAQIRAVYTSCTLIPIAAGWALDRIIFTATRKRELSARAVACLLACLLFFEAPWAAVARSAGMTGLLPLPEQTDTRFLWSCYPDLPKLNALPPGLILGPFDLGVHTLLLTHHSIVTAGYHRNVEGVVASFEAFGGAGIGGTERDMASVVRREGADYVAICTPWVEHRPGNYGPFPKALTSGASVPWLEPIALGTGPLKIWRVRREALPRP